MSVEDLLGSLSVPRSVFLRGRRQTGGEFLGEGGRQGLSHKESDTGSTSRRPFASVDP